MPTALSDTLQNMSVGEGSDNSILLMPKLQYRFRLNFVNFGGESNKYLTAQVIDFTRPNVEFPEVGIDVYNSKVYLAGKPTWQAVTVNLRDDINGEMSKIVGKQVQRQFDFAEQASARAGVDYKFTLKCDMLDGNNGAAAPGVLESWELYGCYLASVNYNQLSYSSNDPATIALSIRFDNAIQSTDGKSTASAGIGLAVGRAAGSLVSGTGA
jgi:hypothetical protein